MFWNPLDAFLEATFYFAAIYWTQYENNWMDFHSEDVRLSYLTVPSISKLHETANNLTDTSGVLHTYFHV